jgi:hypothetical protein
MVADRRGEPMTHRMKGLVLLAMLGFAATSCFGAGEVYVGYGYNHSYYDDIFYTSPMDRYGYGFYGHP